ncbi:IS66 family insertion sequence element accessory protein TnpA [Sorangium sp. So ce590]|uniref:IS66 family insertion sequence element accessory protein TnpA n=1 Tax=Sorangium sp. So ce590 TaxID=3133317 RepID=UPI003F6098AC
MDESTRTWRDRVARWHMSGHSARVFAEQEGVNPGTLYAWSRRLGMKRSECRRRSDAPKLLSFLPVVVYPFGDLHAVLGPERCVKPRAGGIDGREQKHLARPSGALA